MENDESSGFKMRLNRQKVANGVLLTMASINENNIEDGIPQVAGKGFRRFLENDSRPVPPFA